MEPTILARLKDLSAGAGEGSGRISLSVEMAESLVPFVNAKDKNEKPVIDALKSRPAFVTARELARLIKLAEKALASPPAVPAETEK
jgi:hypothetical protein